VRLRIVLAMAAGVFAVVGPADASPTMIRAGYHSCLPCHLSPQGGGLLTDYGKGVDLAQSLFVREYQPAAEGPPWGIVQDVRAQIGLQRSEPLASTVDASASSDLRFWHRAAWHMGKHRFSTVLAADFHSAAGGMSLQEPRLQALRATWDFRPRNGLEISIGKDALPTPIGLPDQTAYIRDVVDPGATVAPTQLKLFLWTSRLSVTPYVYGPGGEEAILNRTTGAGVVSGVNIGSRTVVGVTARMSKSDARDLTRAGGFARVGFGRWGVLTEHEHVTQAAGSAATPDSDRYAGTMMVFAAPREWLVASLTSQLVVNTTGPSPHQHRLTPSVQIRLSDKVTVVASERESFGVTDAARRRGLIVQLFLKTLN
jgi:hypothetical protein